MKEVVKLIERHVYENRLDRASGLNILLDYLIDLFDVSHYINETFESNVQKKSEESPCLFKICLLWFEKVADAMDKGSFFDFFGGIYEEMYQSKSKAKGMGQFFTPPSVAELMTRIQLKDKGKDKHVADNGGCGSGINILAHFAVNGYKDAYYRGDDLDITSVKMAALNMMAHGMRGEVVQHDVLVNPILFDYGFRINDIRYPIPSPFYSLTRIHLTKEDIEKQNERVRKKYGENVKVAKYTGYEVVKPLEGAKPIIKPVFANPPIKEVKQEEVKEEYKGYTQLSLFD